LAVGVIFFGSAAVAAVPITSTKIVGVVTVSIVHETDNFTILAAVTLALRSWVEAFTLATSILLTMQKAGTGIATVTIVPVTSAVVVLYVTEFVTHPGALATLPGALLRVFVIWVQASAVGTVFIIVVATAVTTVPAANLEVVQVIAFTVALELLDPTTFRFRLFCARFKFRIQTLTKSAVLFSLLVGFDIATIAAIPGTSVVIIGVVAKAITFEDEVGETTSRVLDLRV